MPFLNSTMLLPSERATDGNRPPNRITAIMPNTIISLVPIPNIANHSCRSLVIAGKLHIAPRAIEWLCRLFIVGRIFEFFDALLELYDTLPQRPRHRGQSAAEQQQHNKQKYEQLPNTNACR